jgi:hypothetical protein
MRKTIKMPSMANVGAGQTATLNCPVGLTYDLISLQFSGMKADGTTPVTVGDLKNIEVRVNGKAIQMFKDGAELDAINQYHGRGAASGILNLWFARPELAAVRDQRLTSLGTVDVQTLSVHVDVEETLTSIVLSAKAMQSEPQLLGAITKVKAFPASFATSGEHEIDNIPRSGAMIGCVHLFKADVSNVELEVNSIKVFDSSKSYAEELQTRYGKVPQTAIASHVDFMLEGDPAQSLETNNIKDMRIRPTLDTPGALRVVVEYIDGYAGL